MNDLKAYPAWDAGVRWFHWINLLGIGAIHILAVVVTELREGGNLISAMFTGRKVLSGPPADGEPGD